MSSSGHCRQMSEKGYSGLAIKARLYEAKYTRNGCGFCPFAISAFGAVGPSSAEFLFDPEVHYTSGEFPAEVRSGVRNHLGQSLQIALKKEVAGMLLGEAGSSPCWPGADAVDPRE